jgi:hypothetical protein
LSVDIENVRNFLTGVRAIAAESRSPVLSPRELLERVHLVD